MRGAETTNILLLLILLAVLAGFGFLAPILWVLGGVLGLWLLLKILGAIVSGIGNVVDTIENYLGRIFSPVWNLVSAFFGNDIVQWCLVLVATCLAAWFYFVTQKVGYLAAILFLALFALFKAINRWDTIMINRKYKRDDQKDADTVGTPISRRPPQRSPHEVFSHGAPRLYSLSQSTKTSSTLPPDLR